MTMEVNAEELTLNCWVRSREPKPIFKVRIPMTADVSDLRKAIKNKVLNALRDVDAPSLPLYKAAISEENLDKLVLSEQRLLDEFEVLCEVFRDPLHGRDIHVIVDAPSGIDCWMRRAPPDKSFSLRIRPGYWVRDLIPDLKVAQPRLRDVADDSISFYAISGEGGRLGEDLEKPGGGRLLPNGPLAPNFLALPVLRPLCVVIEFFTASGGPTLAHEPVANADGIREYKGIFVKVNNWKDFEESDLQTNGVFEATNVSIPAYVTTFEDMLLDTPCLPHDLPWLHSLQIPQTYFESSAAGDARKQRRCADVPEVMHTTYHVALRNWQIFWAPDAIHAYPFKAHAANSIFFDPLLIEENRTANIQRDRECPITLVLTREDPHDEELRQFRPRSDFLISNPTLPRLLVKVNSVHAQPLKSPPDLVQMLATGAFIVRFANNFVSTFKQQKDFVLCAFYIREDGSSTRYILFQSQTPDDYRVHYNARHFSLNHPLGRVHFARHLYNLLRAQPEQTEAARDAVDKLHLAIRNHPMKKFDTTAGEVDNVAPLQAHGYEVEPDIFIDDSGGEWGPISKAPDHILTVYRPTNPDKQFIAKKAREGSNELEIFRFLNTIPRKSDHVISLIESFDGWAILPKMATVRGYLDFKPEVLESEIPRVCLGLVKGLAYLHGYRIAHRDIKPDNLVVDMNFDLKIIDFDIAVQLRDEDEEIDDLCGTRGWTAPEVEKKSRHSPIKADRWACGRVLLHLLDRFVKEDKALRAFARDLMAQDPKQRPSLLEWDRYLAPPIPDAVNMEKFDTRKASRLRRERGEVEGEITMPPNVKKQRLDIGQRDMGRFRGHGLGIQHVELAK